MQSESNDTALPTIASHAFVWCCCSRNFTGPLGPLITDVSNRDAMMFDEQHLHNTITRAFNDADAYNIPKGITRFDFGNTHGWWVRIRRDRAAFNQFFSDGKNEGIEGALLAAIKHRHEIISSFPLELNPKANSRSLPSDPEKRIHRCVSKGVLQPYTYWRATWYDENHKRKNKSFSVTKFGEEVARALALDCARDNHNFKPKEAISIKPNDPYEKLEFRRMLRSDVAALSTISYKFRGKSELPEEEIDPHGYEGARYFQQHLAIERDRNLRNQKVSQFISENGDVYCESCGFNFKEVYAFLVNNIIEVHHITPLSELDGEAKVTLDDLILLCANCHLAVHQGDCSENLRSLMK